MITATWRKIKDDNQEYTPGQDSPENYYINNDVVNCCVRVLSLVTHRNEIRIEDMRTTFVYGTEPPPNLPYTLTAATLKCRLQIGAIYNAEWRREPYREELAAIFDAANKAR